MRKLVKERESNFELLRIILMLMVLSLHYLGIPLGGALDTKNIPSSDFNYYLARFIESFSIIAVNCYIIITGYFMHTKKEVKYKRILELVLTYFFYLFLIMGLVILFEPKLFNISILKNAIFFKNSGAWFILTYTILYILIPYINLLINSMSKKQFITLLIILLSCFCILPTFLALSQ